MKRRDFFAAGSAGLAALTTATAFAADEPAKEYIEVRKYTVKDAEKRTQFVALLDKAFIPALNRQGIKPVGVLTSAANDAKYALNVFVVIPHKTLDSFVQTNAKLAVDAEYRKDAAPIFETTSKNPVYTDCETFLLNTFPTAPALETPPLGADRRYQMRLYRSFNVERNAAKIRMFDQGGELPVFREVGMNPIFFGEIIAGTRMPALLYMLGFASEAKQNEAWGAFGKHPTWNEIKDKPEYKDTATEIDNIVLFPSSGSQF